MHSDLVSIIIPTYNRSHLIGDTLDSIKKQTYKKLEIVLIYDDVDRSDLNFINFELNP